MSYFLTVDLKAIILLSQPGIQIIVLLLSLLHYQGQL